MHHEHKKVKGVKDCALICISNNAAFLSKKNKFLFYKFISQNVHI